MTADKGGETISVCSWASPVTSSQEANTECCCHRGSQREMQPQFLNKLGHCVKRK